jgi:microcystin degradation protein MlrC
MLNNADILVAFKEYPHTEIVERARELVALAEAAAKATIRPVHAVVDCGHETFSRSSDASWRPSASSW